MIATLLAAIVLAQAPIALASADQPGHREALAGHGGGLESVAVRGEAELDPALAFASARKKAEVHIRDRWLDRAAELVVDRRPFWMPKVLADNAVERWLASFQPQRHLKIVDREDRKRDHGFGSSFQTTLWVAEPRKVVAAGESSLRDELQRVTRKTLFTAGGTVVFWAVLAMLVGWLDRLSRGYMSGRLVLIGLMLASGIPTVAFLL